MIRRDVCPDCNTVVYPPLGHDFSDHGTLCYTCLAGRLTDAIAERDRLRTFVERLTAGVCTCEYMRLFTPVLTRIGVKCQHCEATAVLAEADQ
jgi:hypothetical protein